MSINWVMLDNSGTGFVPLPREKILFTSHERTALSISTPSTYPGKAPLNLNCSTGVAYVTNQRVVYLPETSAPHLQSFSAPILNLMDTHVSAPFFGPNAWTGVVKPVTGGGIPAQHVYVKVKLVFKDGGAYDFHRVFEQVKERLSQALESARETGRTADLSNVPLEQLPAYEEAGSVGSGHQPQNAAPEIVIPTPVRPGFSPNSNLGASASTTIVGNPSSDSAAPTEQVSPPDEPPPAYEEAQSSSVMNSVEETLRREQSH